MTTTRTFFNLTVTRIQSVCQFELLGEGQKITEQVDYPLSLTQRYEDWQRAYLDYYRHLRGRKTIHDLQKQELPNLHLRGWNVINKNFRGRKVISGVGKITLDRSKQLKDAEAQFLDEFYRWLLSPDLINIRREIANAARKLADNYQSVEVFLTCNPIEIARLPWETWEIGADLGIPEKIKIYRTPATIRNQPIRPLKRKARILAIIGYDTHLNFQADKQELESLNSIADIHFVGWNTKKSKVLNADNETELKTEIFNAINDEKGWDILFFAGHSNENILTGGELYVAPNVSLGIQDIAEVLKKAQTRGLQFAIFNSCSGIDIAESLINLGLSQVIVMREPIHNHVARRFLVQFVKSLAEYKDVHQALLDACQYLKQQVTRFSYPSAYLVPSLYRHPDAELFRLKSFLKPLFLWNIRQGDVKRIQLFKLGSHKAVWDKEISPGQTSTMYDGEPLKPGQVYNWRLHIPFPVKQPSFQIMGEDKRNLIASELQQIENKSKQQGTITETIALEKVDLFVSKQMWADALREIYAIPNPSPELKQIQQKIPSFDYCSSNNTPTAMRD